MQNGNGKMSHIIDEKYSESRKRFAALKPLNELIDVRFY